MRTNLALLAIALSIGFILATLYKEIHISSAPVDRQNIVRAQYRHGIGAQRLGQKIELTDQGWLLFARIDSIKIGVFHTIECGIRIFGCYYYLLDRVTGTIRTEEILAIGSSQDVLTFGHELLHAAYVTFSQQTLEKLHEELDKVYSANKSQLDKSLQPYKRISKSEKLNELHSFIGTEVDELTPYLEEHYAQYFKNRSKLVSIAQTRHNEI